ncbi:ISL3 family transposase [Streptomyces echinoruber]|uniref:ISL3 family transposase n=1 Tax=Streptomyces echinoruber TaxID=68898 RepID=UPI001E2AAAEB|nr:ISL3 family transposase [Streptomyces echinoruber]
MAETLAVRASRSTLLRLIRRLPEPGVHTPRVLGVDEFALRKGHDYGTILVGIDTRRPIDLLPGRVTATAAAWLADHPGVEVICRDRSTAYAEAKRLGALDVMHVADRWHVWKNLAEAVEKTVIQHRALLREPENTAPVRAAEPLGSPEPAPRSPDEPRQSGRLSDRVREQHAAVHALLGEGLGRRPIARRPGLARNTVRRLAHAATADELLVGRWTVRASILAPCKSCLHQRWAEGCTVVRRLFEEVRAFAELMNDRRGGDLGQWRERVQADDVPAPHGFVTGLGQDLDAVVAGLSLRYSSGTVEGHNNKIKMIKRQMFGRADFDLLRKRVLLAA